MILVVVLWATTIYTTTEGFSSLSHDSRRGEGFETIQQKVQDRANPLAATQNPLRNPAAAVGIPEAQANELRAVSIAGLNVPTQRANASGGFDISAPVNPISPRIDNENSFLGLVKFCKEAGAKPNPFADPKFAEVCGMCITSGKLVTGETFSKPTGVLVYPKDKEIAINAQKTNGYLFPRAYPSLNSATCVGASMRDDSTPVLAINEKDYDAFTKRKLCRERHQYGKECSQCILNKEYTYVPSNGGTQPVNLWLWGRGQVTVSLAGQKVGQTQNLQDTTPVVFQLGRAKEGLQLQVDVIKGTDPDAPYVYGAIQSTNPNSKPFRLPMERFLEKDSITGSFPRRFTNKRFSEIQLNLSKMVPKPDGDRMILVGPLPLTFIEPDQLARYDCPASPFVSSQDHAEMLVEDPCLNPRGQGPNNYSEECLRTRIVEAGCSTDGNWYKKGLPSNIMAMSLPNIMSWLAGRQGPAKTDVQTSMDCRGIDISTPCDPYIGNDRIPDGPQGLRCLQYLYSNASEKNPRVGRAYKNATASYNSLNKNTIQFCQPDGRLNPNKPEGQAELLRIARGYKGYKGIEAIQYYLSDVFMKAISNLDINEEDSKGGRKTSWMKCFGMTLADPAVLGVRLNSQNSVQDRTLDVGWDTNIPLNPTLRGNNMVAQNVWNSGNYVLEFQITPNGVRGGWSNILRFGTGTGDCCVFGQRSPAIWFFPGNTRLHVRIGDSRDGNWGLDTDALPRGQKSSVRLECNGRNVTLTVNSRVFTAIQPNQRWSGACRVWVSDGIYEAANARIEGLRFKNLT